MASLAELCELYGTDKRPRYHDYAAIYEPLLGPLREAPINLLEIGISAGKSLDVWIDYFPNARIFAIDREPKARRGERVRTAVADQADRVALSRALLEFNFPAWDVVIDDGGHRMDEQQVSLGVLFPWIAPRGLYVIEDVHTSFPQFYPGYGVLPDGSNATYQVLDTFVRTGKIQSPYLVEDEARYLEQHIGWCSYHCRPGPRHSDLAVFRKR